MIGKPTLLTILLLVAMTALPVYVGAESSDTEPVTARLTDKLRGLLQAEMQQVDQAMSTIYTAIVTGDHATVAERARAVHESFILKQSLTPADRKDLQRAVTADFVTRDKAFHQSAAELARAGQQADTRAELEQFEAMTRQCAGCHARYVGDRFPGVSVPEE